MENSVLNGLTIEEIYGNPSIFDYDQYPAVEANWGAEAAQGDSPYDRLDFHVDLGCGKLKKGRIGIDARHAAPVDLVMNLDHHGVFTMPRQQPSGLADVAWLDPDEWEIVEPMRLPFADNQIESIISHHFFEHVGSTFVHLIDECYRVLKPGGILRAITPLFPSLSAVSDPTHVRFITEETWISFEGFPDVPHWQESFSVPYTSARFKIVDQDISPYAEPEQMFRQGDHREIRVALEAQKHTIEEGTA